MRCKYKAGKSAGKECRTGCGAIPGQKGARLNLGGTGCHSKGVRKCLIQLRARIQIIRTAFSNLCS